MAGDHRVSCHPYQSHTSGGLSSLQNAFLELREWQQKHLLYLILPRPNPTASSILAGSRIQCRAASRTSLPYRMSSRSSPPWLQPRLFKHALVTLVRDRACPGLCYYREQSLAVLSARRLLPPSFTLHQTAKAILSILPPHPTSDRLSGSPILP